jgi:parvulin-like peptidyl-prolyl isomerase
VRRRARDDYAFGEIAMTRSDDPRSRPAAGELPFLTRDEIAARLGAEAADAAHATPLGRIADRVIETEQGFQIVKVLAVEEAQEASYDELRDSIKARLTADRREKAFEEFMAAIWKDADVRIDEKALEKLASEKTQKTSE